MKDETQILEHLNEKDNEKEKYKDVPKDQAGQSQGGQSQTGQSQAGQLQTPDIYQLYAEHMRLAEEKEQEARLRKQKIYASHGITLDKLEGAAEYHNATFKGVAIMVEGLTLLLIIAAAIFCGITSTVTIFGIAAFAMEGCLIAQEDRPNFPMRVLARVFFMLPLPMGLTLFSLDLAGVTGLAYQVVLIVFGSLGIVLTGFGKIYYYIHNPYHAQAKEMRLAKAELKTLIRQEKKDAKKHAKLTEKEKKKLQKRLKKQDMKERRREEKRQLKEFARRQREKAEELAEKMKTAKNAKAAKTVKKEESAGAGDISNQETVKQESANQMPVKQEPVKQEPVKQEPLKQEPLKQESLKQEPVKQESANQKNIIDIRKKAKG